MRAIALAVLCLLAAGSGGMLAPGARAECHDSYHRIMAGAAAEWPQVEPFPLPADFTRYFMAAYNAETAAPVPVEADTIVVVPLDSGVSGTWWFFGFANDCLTFYADLGRAKGYHLIEQGHAMLYPGERRIEDWRGWR